MENFLSGGQLLFIIANLPRPVHKSVQRPEILALA